MSLVGFRARNHGQQTMFGARPTDSVDDRAITPELFGMIADRLGGFTVDAAAAAHNARCERYWSVGDSGLEHSWAGERVWCNPPYSNVAPWVEKAHAEADAAVLIVLMLPANRTEQRWWQTHIEPFRDRGGALTVEFLPGRLRFLRPGQQRIGANERPPFGCCLAIWRSSTFDLPRSTS